MKTIITFCLVFLSVAFNSYAQCTSDYSYTGETIDSVQFTNLSVASNAHYYWNFGDGTGSNEQNPLHIYMYSGTYLVTLYVHDTLGGCSDAKDQWISVVKPDTIACDVYFTDSLVGNNINMTNLSTNCMGLSLNCRNVANAWNYCSSNIGSGWGSSLFLHSLDAFTTDSINGYKEVKGYVRTLPYNFSSASNYQDCSANFEISFDYQLTGALVTFTAMNKNATWYRFAVTGFGNPIYTLSPVATQFYSYPWYAEWMVWLVTLEINDSNNNCSKTLSQSILVKNPYWTFPDNCTLFQQPQSQTVYQGADVQFIIQTNPGVSKQWQQDAGLGWDSLTNAGPFTGVYTDTLTVHNVQSWWNNNHYRCLLSNDTNGCHNTTDIANLTVLVIGIDDLQGNNRVHFSPNPFHSTTTLHLNNISPQATLKIYNTLGSLVKEQSITSENTVITREGLSDGIYFVVVSSGEKIFSQKIIVN
jgi:PKD repeat protein